MFRFYLEPIHKTVLVTQTCGNDHEHLLYLGSTDAPIETHKAVVQQLLQAHGHELPFHTIKHDDTCHEHAQPVLAPQRHS